MKIYTKNNQVHFLASMHPYQTFEPKQDLFIYIYVHPMYLSRPKGLDKYMASFDCKISNIDLPSHTVNFIKCCKKLTDKLS